jgi:U3 small nucleolar RNA-associated protein 11
VSERASELFLKGGVHVADRGNVALPQDIVKVLKTQDENYVRTMRAAGLKVYTSSFVKALSDPNSAENRQNKNTTNGYDRFNEAWRAGK